MNIRHIDLFSGIGGFALATEMVWDDVEHIFCDNEPFSQAVLAKHWPNSKIYGDIRGLTANAQHGYELKEKDIQAGRTTTFSSGADLLTGGFPCQPFSQAGRRRGTEDDRYLWPEMLRVIHEFQPRWVIGENVGGFVTWSGGLVLEQVHADLESEGYEVQAFIIPAVSVNAPHRRDRVWIVAHSKSDATSGRPEKIPGKDGRQKWNNVPESGDSNRIQTRTTSDTRQQHGESGGNEGVENNPLERTTRSIDTKRQDKDASDSERLGHSRKINQTGQSARHSGRTQQSDWNQDWAEVASRLCRVDDGIPKRLDRNPRLKGLGNAIVPQVAAEIMKVIKQIDL